MELRNLLQKYKDLEFEHSIDLFNDIPFYAINQNRCPFCGLKLYEMRNNKLRYCKSKKCPKLIQTHKSFICKK